MATTPETKSSIFNLSADWTWIIQHAFLLILAAALAVGSVYYVEGLIAKHDAATEARYSQVLTQQTAQTSLLEAQLKTDENNWTQLSTQLNAQNAADQQQISARDAQITQLLTKISQMQPPQIVADLQPKLHAGTATILPDGVKLDTPAARDVDAQMTQGAAAEADLTTTKSELTNETTLAVEASKNLTEANGALAAEQKKNVDQVAACTAEVNTVKAQARKGKLKWFGIGVVVGYLGRVLTHP